MKLIVARTLAELRPHAEAWNGLAFASPQQLPTAGYAWLAPYFEHRLVAGESWFCVLAYDSDELVGVFPVVVSPRAIGPLHARIIRTPADLHTLSVDLLTATGRATEVVPRLLESAQKECPNALWIELRRLPENSPTLPVLAERRLPMSVASFYGVGAYLPIRGTLSDYSKSLSKNFRSNLNKASNKLARLNDVRVVFKRPDRPNETQEDLDALMAIEASGWKGETGSAIASEPERVAFYRSLTKELARAGWLEWQFLEAEGRQLAGNLAIRLERSLVVWKLGYLDDYRRCSPGSLLFKAIIERAFDTGEPAEINLMTDMSWYDNWRMVKRPYFDLFVFSHRQPLGLLLGLVPRYLRRRLRQVPWLRKTVRELRRRRSEAART